jgi:hypothetical protein
MVLHSKEKHPCSAGGSAGLQSRSISTRRLTPVLIRTRGWSEQKREGRRKTHPKGIDPRGSPERAKEDELGKGSEQAQETQGLSLRKDVCHE